MKISYNKLWKLLIDLKIGKTELRYRTGIASSTFTKLRNDEEVSMSIIRKICEELNCGIGDVLEFKKDNLQQ